MKNSIAAPKMETMTLNPDEIYNDFLDNIMERADETVSVLADKIAEETDSAKILELQKELKRARRKWSVLNRLRDGIRPLAMEEIISSVAEPQVMEELKTTMDMVIDLRETLGLVERDLAERSHE